MKILAVALAFALIGPAAAFAACSAPANYSQMASDIATGVNATRAARGLPGLAYNPTLGQSAMDHACDMAAHGLRAHRGSNGSNSQVRAKARGYKPCTIAENVAWDYPRSAQVWRGWARSPSHLSNMLHPRITEMGVGIANGPKGPQYVLVLGRSC